jgi:hypothetical protein
MWQFMRGLAGKESLPFDMFDVELTAAEARRAKRMANIYHVGQDRAWDGRNILQELVAKHGAPTVDPAIRDSLGHVFAVILWGELAAWRVAAQLSDLVVPLEAKMAAASQVHDEARHFYVMHDYLALLGPMPPPPKRWCRHVLGMTLGTKSLAKKLLGMQFTIESVALTVFQRVRERNIEPVLTDLLSFFERDEARHVGLGVQLLPSLIGEMTLADKIDFGLFNLELVSCNLAALKKSSSRGSAGSASIRAKSSK